MSNASKNEKLLMSDEICFMCHDQAAFSKKTVHPPVAAMMCTSCHNPHSSNQQRMLRNRDI